MKGRMRNWILRTAVLAESVVMACGRVLMGLHRLKIRVAFDKFLCAASWETHGDAPVVIFAFHADDCSNAVFRMTDLLAKQRIGLAAAHDGRATERTRGRRAPLWRAFLRRGGAA